MDRLVRLEGKVGAAETLIGDLLTVGRGEENRLRLFDESASRRHATLFREQGRIVVEDLGSSNGTKVNGARVGRAVLCDGDEISFGAVRVRFLSSEASDRPTRVEGPAPESEPLPEDGTVEASVDPAVADPAAGGGAAAVERLRLVCRAAEVAAEAVDPDRLAAALVELLTESMRPDRATIHLGSGAALRIAADHPRGTGRPVASRTLLRRVLESGEAVLVRDARDAQARAAHASLLSSPFRSTLAAPLATVEGTAGLVVLQAEAPDRWTADDLAVLAAVARQGGLALRTLSALSVARAEVRRLSPRALPSGPELLGKAPALARLTEAADKAAATDATVLIRGETGTGKELVARRLHANSARAAGPFVAINCAAIVEGLLESEMFGHEKGAFTSADARKDGRIAEAAGGTLFLDEVGELSPALQAKLLRVLSDKTFTRLGGRDVLRMECRLVAATHRDLPAMVANGRFREDLWYRLAVVTLDCPPLRERGDDVLLLADAFLERIAARLGRRTPTLSADGRARLVAHRWPGNVRELENALERAIVLSSGDVLTAADLPSPVAVPVGMQSAGDGPISMREAEKRALVAALAHTKGKKGEAAALLGISWPTLNRKIREYGLE